MRDLEAVDEMGLQIGDGSWELKLLVTDLQVERTIRVLGDDHIGGVMIKLVDILDIAMDWSDHAVWWPTKNMWLNNTRCRMSAQFYNYLDKYVWLSPSAKLSWTSNKLKT